MNYSQHCYIATQRLVTSQEATVSCELSIIWEESAFILTNFMIYAYSFVVLCLFCCGYNISSKYFPVACLPTHFRMFISII